MTPAQKAVIASRVTGEAWVVAEVDHNDTRRRVAMPESDTQYDEFIAFAGEIIAVFIDGQILD